MTWEALEPDAASFELSPGELSALRAAAGDLGKWTEGPPSGPRTTPGSTFTITQDGVVHSTTRPVRPLDRIVLRLVNQLMFVRGLAQGREYFEPVSAVAQAFRPSALRVPLLTHLAETASDQEFLETLTALHRVVSDIEYSGLVAAELHGPRAGKTIDLAVRQMMDVELPRYLQVTQVLISALEEVIPRWLEMPENERGPYRRVVVFIGRHHLWDGIPLLLKLLTAEPQDGWGEVTQALAQLGARATPDLIPMLESKDVKQRRSAVTVLQRMVDFGQVNARGAWHETQVFRDRGLARLRQIAVGDPDVPLRKKARGVLPRLEKALRSEEG